MAERFYEEGAPREGNVFQVEMPDQSFGKARRLLKNRDFQKVYAEGRRKNTPFFTIHSLKVNSQQETRFGLSVGRKTANAVGRNRIKRRLRELVRTYPQPLQQGCWIVITAKAETATMDLKVLRAMLYQFISEMVT